MLVTYTAHFPIVWMLPDLCCFTTIFPTLPISLGKFITSVLTSAFFSVAQFIQQKKNISNILFIKGTLSNGLFARTVMFISCK